MGMQQQGQQLEDPLKAQKQKKRLNDKRWLIAIIALVLIAGGAIFWLRDTQGSVYTILPIVIFTVLGIVVSLFQWLFPVSSGASSQPMAVIHPSLLTQLMQSAQVAPQAPPQIIVHVPSVDPPPPQHAAQTGPLDKASYRGIMGVPPPTDQRSAVRGLNATLTRSPGTNGVLSPAWATASSYWPSVM